MFPKDSRILIVDDSSFSRTMMKSTLRDLGFAEIVEAGGAKEASGLLQDPKSSENPIQLLIIDIHMPEMSGLDLLRWVMGQDAFKDMPVIILTSSQDKSDVLQAGRLGVTHFMIKPFDAETLKERLASAWQRQGQKFYNRRKNSA
jgi:two-component system chemotaxis response regulator CheY